MHYMLQFPRNHRKERAKAQGSGAGRGILGWLANHISAHWRKCPAQMIGGSVLRPARKPATTLRVEERPRGMSSMVRSPTPGATGRVVIP